MPLVSFCFEFTSSLILSSTSASVSSDDDDRLALVLRARSALAAAFAFNAFTFDGLNSSGLLFRRIGGAGLSTHTGNDKSRKFSCRDFV